MCTHLHSLLHPYILITLVYSFVSDDAFANGILSPRFVVSNEVRQAVEERVLEATPSTVMPVTPARRRRRSARRDVAAALVALLEDARGSSSCQRGCGDDGVPRVTRPITLKRWMPACRHAVLTDVVRRSEILRLRGGIFGWKSRPRSLSADIIRRQVEVDRQAGRQAGRRDARGAPMILWEWFGSLTRENGVYRGIMLRFISFVYKVYL